MILLATKTSCYFCMISFPDETQSLHISMVGRAPVSFNSASLSCKPLPPPFICLLVHITHHRWDNFQLTTLCHNHRHNQSYYQVSCTHHSPRGSTSIHAYPTAAYPELLPLAGLGKESRDRIGWRKRVLGPSNGLWNGYTFTPSFLPPRPKLSTTTSPATTAVRKQTDPWCATTPTGARLSLCAFCWGRRDTYTRSSWERWEQR